MSLDEFVRRYHEEGPFEIIDGEIVPMTPGLAVHVVVIKRLMKWLVAYEERSGEVEVCQEAPYVLTCATDWVTGARVPDVMCYKKKCVLSSEFHG